MIGGVRPGKVTQASPLRVRLNGDTADAPSRALDDFTGATTATEVLVVTVEGQRYAWRVR